MDIPLVQDGSVTIRVRSDSLTTDETVETSEYLDNLVRRHDQAYEFKVWLTEIRKTRPDKNQ